MPVCPTAVSVTATATQSCPTPACEATAPTWAVTRWGLVSAERGSLRRSGLHCIELPCYFHLPRIWQLCIEHLLRAGCWVLSSGWNKDAGLHECCSYITNRNMHGGITRLYVIMCDVGVRSAGMSFRPCDLRAPVTTTPAQTKSPSNTGRFKIVHNKKPESHPLPRK